MRSCGTCSLCCKVLGVPDIKEKKDFEWCPHCTKPGCGIYKDRPQVCRDFKCMWLIDEQFGPDWFPARSKILIDHKIVDDKGYIVFVVDHDYPTRWKEEPWFSDIKKVASAGLSGSLGAKWTTVVLVKGDRIVIGL